MEFKKLKQLKEYEFQIENKVYNNEMFLNLISECKEEKRQIKDGDILADYNTEFFMAINKSLSFLHSLEGQKVSINFIDDGQEKETLFKTPSQAKGYIFRRFATFGIKPRKNSINNCYEIKMDNNETLLNTIKDITILN